MSQELPGMGLPPLPSVALSHLDKSHILLALDSSSVSQVASLQASPGWLVLSVEKLSSLPFPTGQCVPYH